MKPTPFLLVTLTLFSSCSQKAATKPVSVGDVVYQSDTVLVKLTDAKIGKVTEDSKFESLRLDLDITNQQKNKKAGFDLWSPHPLKLGKSNTKAVDEFENRYTVVPCRGSTCRKSLLPGESVTDSVILHEDRTNGQDFHGHTNRERAHQR